MVAIAAAAVAVATMEDVLHQGPRVDMIHVERAGDQRHGQAMGFARLPARADAVVCQSNEAGRHNNTEKVSTGTLCKY